MRLVAGLAQMQGEQVRELLVVFDDQRDAIGLLAAARHGAKLKVVEVPVQDAIRNAEAILAGLGAALRGLSGMGRALALWFAKRGVTVNTISPGYIGTKMVMAIPTDILDSKILPQIPVGRLGMPAEVAGLIIYLCSEEAVPPSSERIFHITGPASSRRSSRPTRSCS